MSFANLGSILKSRFSVILFSNLNCSVLSATRASRLLAYFSIIASMLSKMLDFLWIMYNPFVLSARKLYVLHTIHHLIDVLVTLYLFLELG